MGRADMPLRSTTAVSHAPSPSRFFPFGGGRLAFPHLLIVCALRRCFFPEPPLPLFLTARALSPLPPASLPPVLLRLALGQWGMTNEFVNFLNTSIGATVAAAIAIVARCCTL